MTKPVYRRVVVKVSGEALMGPDRFGIHQPTLERIAVDLLAARALGVAIAVVVGGGNIFRGVQVSAKTEEGIGDLLEAMAVAVPRPPVEVTLLVPYGREDVTARLYREAEVLGAEPDERGTVVVARVDERHLAQLRSFVTRPVTRRVPVSGGE